MKELKLVVFRDFERLNQLVNLPEIRDGMIDDSITEPIDTKQFNLRENVFFAVKADDELVGFVSFIYKGLSVYELHSGFLPEYRGIHVLQMLQKGIDWLFTSTSAEIVTTWAMAKNVAWVAHKVGFMDDFQLLWPNTIKGKSATRRVLSQGIMDWARTQNKRYQALGNKVVADVMPEMRGYLGMALMMGLNSQQVKAQEFWNRHAVFVSAPIIQVFAPRAGSMVFSIGNQTFELQRDLSIFNIQEMN